jgi:hypothetical protein
LLTWLLQRLIVLKEKKLAKKERFGNEISQQEMYELKNEQSRKNCYGRFLFLKNDFL